jgi:transposase
MSAGDRLVLVWMVRSWVDSDLGKQSALPVMDIRDLLPSDHPVWGFIATCARFDMSTFERAYRNDGVGRRPYDPRMMLTLILYCWHKGVRSGAGIAMATFDDNGARVITGNQHPDRSTVNNFVGTHRAAIEDLLAQTLRLGDELGLVDVRVVAGDGTKLVANAAMGATVDEARLVAQIADLEQELAAAERAWYGLAGRIPTVMACLLGAEDAPLPAWQLADDEAAKRVRALALKLRCRRAALQHLRAHPNRDVIEWQERLDKALDRIPHHEANLDALRAQLQAERETSRQLEAAGLKGPARNTVPVEEHSWVLRAKQTLAAAVTRANAIAAQRPTTSRVNTTDPASRIMPGKRDGYDQRHNLQVLSCPNQFIIAVTLHDSSNDKQAMIRLLHTARRNLDTADITREIGTALFDSGYASQDNFAADVPCDRVLVAVEKEARQTGRRRDDITNAATAWREMADRLAEPDNRATYKMRGGIVEPVFAQLFSRFGSVTLYRGDNVLTEVHLWAITHNILKIHRAQRRRTPT